MALRHKGLDFELRSVSFKDIPDIEDGSFKSVPVFNDNGHLEGDSFEIAVYLDQKYCNGDSLFGGSGGEAMARFIESFAATVLHPVISTITVIDMHDMMSPEDQKHFRAAREKRSGKNLEAVYAGKEQALAELPQKLSPMRSVLTRQPWIGGDKPLFADHILFGAFQWGRVCSPAKLLAGDDPVHEWFERCLDLYGGIGRSARAF
jgi:glutathione S-transferase